jgi:hypothetical protein
VAVLTTTSEAMGRSKSAYGHVLAMGINLPRALESRWATKVPRNVDEISEVTEHSDSRRDEREANTRPATVPNSGRTVISA